MKKFSNLLIPAFLMFIAVSAQARSYTSLISYDNLDGITTYADTTASISLLSVAGQVANGAELTYDLGTGNWVAANKDINTNMSTIESIRFWVKGTGQENKLEIKFKDSQGRIAGKILETVKSNAAAWTQVEIVKADLTYFWGGPDANFDWTNVATFEPAISKIAGGTGTTILDNLEYGHPAPPPSTTVTVTVVNPEVSVEVTGTVSLGTVLAGQSAVSQSAVTVANTGNTTALFKLGLTNPSGWTAVSTDTEVASDKYLLNAAFNTNNIVTWSTTDQHLTTTETAASGTRFASDQSGSSVAAGTTRSLWFQFKAPTLVTDSGTAKNIVVSVTGVAMP